MERANTKPQTVKVQNMCMCLSVIVVLVGWSELNYINYSHEYYLGRLGLRRAY